MNVSLNQMQLGIVDYIEKEIASKAVGLQRFMYYGISFVVANNAEKLFALAVNNPMVKQLGFMDEDNNIDLDKLYAMAKYAMQKSGKVSVGGVILGEDDVEKIYGCVRNAG